MTEADITIGIPTLNRAELVEPLVRSCLSQTQSPLQIVVSDNASSDDTLARLAVIKDSRLKVICQSTNIGMIGNWNACLNESEGEWFVLLSDDDQIDPDYVENFQSAIALAADVDLLIMHCRVLNKIEGRLNENRPPIIQPGEINIGERVLPAWLAGAFDLPFAGMVFKTSTLKAAGGFSTAMPFAADVATWLPVALQGRCSFWPDTKVTYLLHQSMTTWKFPVTKLIEDVLAIRSLILTEVERSPRLSTAEKRQLRSLSDTYVRNNFGHILLQATKRGVPKRELISAWKQFYSLLPNSGLSIPSVSAVLIPGTAITKFGAPYRKYREWKTARRWRPSPSRP